MERKKVGFLLLQCMNMIAIFQFIRQMTKILKSTDLEYFQQKGYLRIPEAFSPSKALVMQT